MTPTVLLLDVDGVLADFLTPTLRAVVQAGGPEVDPATFTSWDIFDVFPEEHLRAAMLDLWHQDGFCHSLKPYPGAQEAVAELRKHAEIAFVTSAMHSKFWHWERVEWLAELFGSNKLDVTFTHQKHLMRGDVFIDDKASSVLAWADANPLGMAYLWDRSYNASVVLPESIWLQRTLDWNEVLEFVKSLRKYKISDAASKS